LTDFYIFGTILLRGFKAIDSTCGHCASFNSVAKNTGIKFSTALALLKMSETIIVHKAVRGAISKLCIEWQKTMAIMGFGGYYDKALGACSLLLNNTSMVRKNNNSKTFAPCRVPMRLLERLDSIHTDSNRLQICR
jgi:hypothetical protein